MEKSLSREPQFICLSSVFSAFPGVLRMGFVCWVVSILLPFFVSGKDLRDFAQVYVDQYFEPPEELKLSPSSEAKAEALAYFTVGRIQENAGQTDEAVASYLRVLKLQPDQLGLSRKCAYLLARSGKQTEARELLEAALERNRSSAFPYIMLSEFLSTYHSNNQENKESSLTLAKEAVDRFPDDPLTYEHLTKMYLTGNRKEDAQALLARSLEQENPDPEFWLRLGKVASRVWQVRMGGKGEEKEVEMLNRFYGKASAHAAGNDAVLERSADFYKDTRQYEKAEKLYLSLIKRKTDRLDLRKKLAKVYKEQKNDEAYLKTLLGIVQVNPVDVQTHYEIAREYVKKNDVPNAIKHRKIALKVGKGSAQDYLKVGTTMFESQMYEECAEFLKEAAYLFPDNPEFPWLITYPLGALEKYKEATKYFEQYEKMVKKQRPENLTEKFYFRFGSAVERDGDIKRAEKYFQKTIELLGKKDPEEEDKKFTALVYNYLGYMWLENDMNIDEAGELIKTAVDLDPDSGAIADSLGWFYFKKGRFEEAKKELLRSESLIEEVDAVILDHIARVYYELGDNAKAIEYMERAVKLKPDEKEYSERLDQFQKGSPAAPKEVVSPEPAN